MRCRRFVQCCHHHRYIEAGEHERCGVAERSEFEAKIYTSFRMEMRPISRVSWGHIFKERNDWTKYAPCFGSYFLLGVTCGDTVGTVTRRKHPCNGATCGRNMSSETLQAQGCKTKGRCHSGSHSTQQTHSKRGDVEISLGVSPLSNKGDKD